MSGQERMSTLEYRRRMGIGAPTKSKFGNKKTPADDGVVMDSGREATRYKDLVRLQEAGQISNLRRQVKFSIDVSGVHICDYLADFTYTVNPTAEFPDCWDPVVEDSKGHATREYKMKRALMLACHGVRILET